MDGGATGTDARRGDGVKAGGGSDTGPDEGASSASRSGSTTIGGRLGGKLAGSLGGWSAWVGVGVTGGGVVTAFARATETSGSGPALEG